MLNRREWTFIDKSTWPNCGPWDSEPDKVQWTDDSTGLACMAVRNTSMGNWCGYVGVAADHPAFKKHHDDIDVTVHGGGLTFAGPCDPRGHSDTEPRICHIPDPGTPDELWWLGFDCGHCFDMFPGLPFRSSFPENLYRDLPFVESECRSLAAQLAQMKFGMKPIPLRSAWHYFETPTAVIIYDASPGTHKMTVTNDAENVIDALFSSGVLSNKRVFYFDTQGRFDEILIENNHFAGFAPIHAQSLPNALLALLP